VTKWVEVACLTSALEVVGSGCLVQTQTEAGHVSTVFVPGVRIVNKTLIPDMRKAPLISTPSELSPEFLDNPHHIAFEEF
jgi:hypothetical protein